MELRWFLSPCRDSWCQEGSGRVRTGLLGRDARLWEELRASQLAGLGLVLGTFTEHLLSARPCGHSRKAGRPGPALMGCICRDILCPPPHCPPHQVNPILASLPLSSLGMLTLGVVLCPGKSTVLAELRFNPGSAVTMLCDPRQITSCLWTCVPSSVN